MKRISSSWILFSKKVTPILQFGILCFFIALMAISLLMVQTNFLFLGAFAIFFICIFIYVSKISKKMFQHIDSVYDDGIALFFKHKGQELHLDFTDIDSTSYNYADLPQLIPIITIYPKNETTLGRELSFIAPRNFTQEKFDELDARIEARKNASDEVRQQQEQKQLEKPLASLVTRIFASFIDLLILLPILSIFSAILLVDKQFFSIAKIFAATFGCYMLVNCWPIFSNGQTIGKLLLKIRVVDKKSKRNVNGFKYIFFRSLPLWAILLMTSFPHTAISIAANIVLALTCLLIFRAEKNCLYDDIAGTRVVKVT